MSQRSILVIEDDRHILELLRVCLEQEGYRVVTEENGLKGLERARREPFDLIVLDLMLPGKDGLSVCRELAAGGDDHPPILILTARGAETDRVLGLKLGADDYVVKPFSPRELAARVEAILRRVERKQPESAKELAAADITVNLEGYTAAVGDTGLNLTPKEFELLALMLRYPGRVFTREQLLNLIWGYEYTGGTRTVDEHIKNLRQKLKEAGAPATRIQTVWGIGYKFDPRE